MNPMTDIGSFALLAGEAGFDRIEDRMRTSVRATIETVFEEELTSFLGRLRYGRGVGPGEGLSPRPLRAAAHRHLRHRDLADEDIVRLILDGTVITTRLDRKATNIPVLAAIGVRRPSCPVN